MSFDDNLFHFEVQQVIEKNQNNLIDSRFDHRDKIALFLKSHFHNVDEVEKRNSLNIDSCSTKFLLNSFCFFNELTLIRVLVHYFD